MEMARSERILNAGRNYGRELGYRQFKRAKSCSILSVSRDPAVRSRMARVAGGTGSLDKGEVGVDELKGEVSGFGRPLKPPELWELLIFISEENRKVELKCGRGRPHNEDFSGTFGKKVVGKRKQADVEDPAERDPFQAFKSKDVVTNKRAKGGGGGKKKSLARKKARQPPQGHKTTVGRDESGVYFESSSVEPGGPKVCQITSLSLGSWNSVCIGSLRSLSLTLGSTLKHVSLTYCANLTNEMLESFVARLYCLESLDLSGCALVGDSGCHSLSDFCGSTLTALNLSRCPALTHDSCGWLSGTLGHNRRGCWNLRSLDLSNCENIDDKALGYLGEGCKR